MERMTPGGKFEIVKKYVEQKEEKALKKCLAELMKRSEQIGFGDNAVVLGIKDKHFGDVCMKKMKKVPKILCNDIDTEFEYQQEVGALGVRVPKLIAYIKDTETGDFYILMEKINGPTPGDIIMGLAPIPENYDHDKYWAKVDQYLDIMHENGIHHRDLHKKNLMIDTEDDCNPVMIDFGTAGRAFGSEDDPYKETVPVLNEATGKYEVTRGYFQQDKRKVEWTKNEMAKLLRN